MLVAAAVLASGGGAFAVAEMAVAGDPPQTNAPAAVLPEDAELRVMEVLRQDAAFATLHGGRGDFVIRRLGPWTIDGKLVGAAAELEWSEPFDVSDGSWPVLDPSVSPWDIEPYKITAIRLSARGLSSAMVLVDLNANLLVTVTPIFALPPDSSHAAGAGAAGGSRAPAGPPPASPDVTATGPIPPGPSERD